jgi:hypothetical protein
MAADEGGGGAISGQDSSRATEGPADALAAAIIDHAAKPDPAMLTKASRLLDQQTEHGHKAG